MNHTLESALEEISQLKSALAKAQASCAEMRQAMRKYGCLNPCADASPCGECEVCKALSTDCGSALRARVATMEAALKRARQQTTSLADEEIEKALSGTAANELMAELQRYRELPAWLDQKIDECKKACKKATPFDFERGSDLTAYTAVKNFLKSEGWV